MAITEQDVSLTTGERCTYDTSAVSREVSKTETKGSWSNQIECWFSLLALRTWHGVNFSPPMLIPAGLFSFHHAVPLGASKGISE